MVALDTGVQLLPLGDGVLGESEVTLWEWPFTIDNDGVVIANGVTQIFNLDARPEHFAQRSFDAITWTFGLHYCPTAEQALATLNGMADLLRPGGAFFLVDLARFKREDTWRWFSNKYDRAHGDQFFQEIRDSYLASFSRDELADLLRQSRFSGITQEWSYLFPVLLLAHNRRADRTMPTLTSEPIHLPWRQRLKHATLRRLYALSALRSPI